MDRFAETNNVTRPCSPFAAATIGGNRFCLTCHSSVYAFLYPIADISCLSCAFTSPWRVFHYLITFQKEPSVFLLLGREPTVPASLSRITKGPGGIDDCDATFLDFSSRNLVIGFTFKWNSAETNRYIVSFVGSSSSWNLLSDSKRCISSKCLNRCIIILRANIKDLQKFKSNQLTDRVNNSPLSWFLFLKPRINHDYR